MKIRCVLFAVFLISTAVMAQQSINSAGGSATGSGGVVTPTGTAPIAYGYPIQVYPNPATDLLQIDAGNAGSLRYELRDAAGKMVQKGNMKNGKGTLNTASSVRGNYQLTILHHKSVQCSFNKL